MGIIFQNGFGLGTAPGNVVGNIWDPQYTSNGLSTYPNVFSDLNNPNYLGITIYNSSISDAYAPGIYTALAKTAISTGQKYMITFGLDFDIESNEPNYWLGFGSRSIDLYNYLGSNDNSVGIANTGDVNYGGTTIYSSLPTFGTVGDIIDVAIDGNNYIWYRVNGGDWNGNNTANPATNNGGLDISTLFGGATLYPAISLLGNYGPSVFSVYETSPYGLPSGFTQIAGDRPPAASFTIASNLIDTGSGYGPVCGSSEGEWNGLTGFTIANPTNLWCGVGCHLSGYTQIEAAFTSQGATMQGGGYIFDVQWGTGSTVTYGVAKVGYESYSHLLRISTVDPTDIDYLTSDNNPSDSTSLAGTFNFPATFTFRVPIISKGGWC